MTIVQTYVQGQQAVKASKCRGDPQPLHPEPLVTAQPWFEDGSGFARLAKNVRQGHVNIWELRSVIELVDILLWPYVKASKGLDLLSSSYHATQCSFVNSWFTFGFATTSKLIDNALMVDLAKGVDTP